ncbi:hypothetical protein ACUTR7_24825 [Delftia sp. NA_296.1]|uniref:hypothetical protein n=1 Tax=Delftia sp. NA_296.1 TaxID=3415648 RepID=UPI004046041B
MISYQLSSEAGHVFRWRDGVRATIPLVDAPGLPSNPDAVEYRAWLAAGGVPLPAELWSAAEIAAGMRGALAAEYRRRMQVIAAGYPLSERESWSVQTEEARELEADTAASTPWINAAAAARGLDRLVLAKRILAKDAKYRQIHGELTGTRQRIEDQIDALAGDAEALSKIDVTVGWPSFEEDA